ncbi:MAG TPA: hypothetical protein VIE86_05685 [Nitrososphaera sp.]|jgi:predicted ArsR family transcriptional regulator
MGSKGIETFLEERQEELYVKYHERLEGLDFDLKVKELARIRNEEGYIAESKKLLKNDGLDANQAKNFYNVSILLKYG